MTKNTIDYLILNNCPAFYKINLYNELSKKCKIHVVFIGMTDQVVISDLFEKDIHFSYNIITKNALQSRNVVFSLIQIIKIIFKFKFNKIIYGGYDLFELLFIPFMISRSKNCLQFESSIFESSTKGIRGFIKKILLKRYSCVFASSDLQSRVLEVLGYRGKIIESFGVGIFNKNKNRILNLNHDTKDFKYLFVGRLISKKNLNFLINTFNKINKKLTIVGTGLLENDLKEISNSNISFSGFVPNSEIWEYYLNHDIFILPSLVEPWGLVVEEAVYFSIPVLVSDSVGCKHEIVEKTNTGIIFSPTDEFSLINAIDKLESNYSLYFENCKKFDFKIRDSRQIESYLSLII